MSMNHKKDVHKTGALASILSQADIKPIQIPTKSSVTEAKNITTDKTTETITPREDTARGEKLLEIPPTLCRPWNFSDRLEPEMGNIEELANSIQQAGQQEPILVRPIKSYTPSDQYKYEIIFGNRRWRACTLLNKNLLAIVRNLSDQEAALAQKEENENRRDISDYSKAIHYKKLIESGVFENENQLSIKLNIPRNRLNDLMSYSRIPAELITMITNIHKLPQRMAIRLASLAKDKENLQALIKLAPKISENKVTSVNVEKAIHEIKNGKFSHDNKKNLPVVGKGGAELFTVREDSNGAPCIVLHKVSRQAVNMDDLKHLIKSYIDKCIEENFSEEKAGI